MTIRHLRIFIEVAKTQNMSKAAEKLYISQPTVSQAIKELEEYYGILLFERLNKRLHITELGKKLYFNAKKVVNSFDDLDKKMAYINEIEEIKIGATVTVGDCILSDIISRLRQEHPKAEIYTFVGNTKAIEGKLLNNELGIGIVEGNIKSSDLIVKPELNDYLVLISSSKHPFAKKKEIKLEELSNENFAMREEGSGKTTLLKTASRLIKPYSGDVLLNENSIFNITSKEVARHISYLPQNRDVPSIKAYDLVMHGRFPYLKFPRIPTDDDKRLAEEAIERLKITEYKDKNIRELSGGERQKVYLAMILAQDTDIIFLDEPTTFLDINHQLEILKIVKDLKKMGKTIVMVIHDLNSALTYSDKVCLMDKGQIVIYDTPQNVYKSKLIENTFEIQCQELSVSNKGERQYVFSI